MMIVIMGVSGCGKTTVGKLLADELQIPFYDADDFHPQSNIEKMKNGVPLDDSDRLPWLQMLSTEMNRWEQDGGAILACSALKESYRKLLSSQTSVNWVYLHGSFDTILDRMKTRQHFMKPEMLQSQFDTLEVPSYALELDITKNPEELVAEIQSKFSPS
ncbi:MAG: gluconokinase [Flavobacteriaceae bacterium]|nr:gluconokinase [Flavobacteriaceae bacterium]